MDPFKIPLDQAVEAYAKEKNPSLTDQLLYAVLAQLDKANHQLEELISVTETSE